MPDFLNLADKTVLVLGVANRKSVAWFVGRSLEEQGARVVYSVRSEARRKSLETQLAAAPAATWAEAAEKARYLLGLYAATLATEDTRHRELVAAVLADFERLSRR